MRGTSSGASPSGASPSGASAVWHNCKSLILNGLWRIGKKNDWRGGHAQLNGRHRCDTRRCGVSADFTRIHVFTSASCSPRHTRNLSLFRCIVIGARYFVVPYTRDGIALFTTNEQAMKTKATAKPSVKASDTVKTTEQAPIGITFEKSFLSQERANRIVSAFQSARGRLKAVEEQAVSQGILRSGHDWLGDSVVKTDASQALRVAGRLERSGLISQGDAKALKEYMALRNAMSALGL